MPLNDPLGSTASDVLAFNVAKEDEFINSTNDYYTDRFGVTRYTAQGLATLAGGGTISPPAISVSYDDSSSVIVAGNVQVALDAITAGTKNPYRIGNAIVSWWSNPVFLNAGRYSYLACSDNRGALKLGVTDNLNGNTQSYLTDVDNFNPDDHNTGSVASDGTNVLAIWPGRRNTTDTAACYYQTFTAGQEPSLGLTKLSGANNYPQVYDINDKFLMFGRTTQNANVPQWTYRISDWPLSTWGAEKTLFQSTFTWPYIASRRSAVDKNRIILGLAWHPINSDSDNSIRYAHVQRVNSGTGDWHVVSGGSVVAGLNTDVNMPLDENDFELVYTPTAPNTTRLLGIADEALLFIEYDSTGDGSDGVYKYAKKVSGSWVVNDIVASGVPFQVEAATLYHGGGAIDSNDANSVVVAREASGIWYYERHITADNGSTWTRKEVYKGNEEAWQDMILARPMFEDYSFTQWGSDRSKLRSICFVGRYNEIEYDDFDTDIVDERYLASEYNPFPVEANRLQNRFVTSVSSSTTLKRRWREWSFLITNGSAITITIPTDADESIPVGSRFELIGNGSTVTVQAAAGVSLNYTSGGSFTFGNRERVILIKVAANSWFPFKDNQVTVS